MKLLKKITNYIYILIVVFIVGLAITTALSVFQNPSGLRLFVVQSGSMEPKIKTGSLVLVSSQEKYQENDIITFKTNLKANLKDPNSTVTHRIIKIKDDEGRATFTTQGDANNAPDSEDVEITRVLGKVLINLPYVGKVVAFAKTQLGFVFLIIVPATLIIYSEATSIKKEALKLFKDHQKSKADQKSEHNGN